MPYPFWDVPIAYGILIAIVAVLHVFVSHFAIGGGLYLVLAERSARKADDTQRLDFLRRLSKGFILITLVFGALSGVGIWFVIGLISPAATEVLIHNFVWGWAIEWTFFLVEIAAAILYYYGWTRMSARGHMTLGWIYFVAAWLSLVVINGIVTFMLTPGAWLETGGFWDAFFNPTYWPSLVFRTAVSVLMAGLFALAFAATYPWSPLKARLVRGNAAWAVVGLLGAALSGWLWYRAAIPADVLAIAAERLTIARDALQLGVLLTLALGALLVLFGLGAPRAWGRPLALLALVGGLVWFGAFEWYREAARKPYSIYGYMYGNGYRVDQVDRFRDDGLLAHVPFRTDDAGADLFRYSCRTCHTLDGYNPVLPAFAGTDEAFVAGSLTGLHEMRGKMPPFLGSDDEREILAAWLWARADQRPFTEVHRLEGVALGKKVHEIRCGACHVHGGYKDNRTALAGGDRELIEEILAEEDFAEGMPDFTGSDAEREALVEYIMTWREAETD